jgi:hypothetical protein
MQKTGISVLHALKYLSTMLVLFACLFIVELIRPNSQHAAPAAAVAPNIQIAPVNSGVVILNEDKGMVDFCSFSSTGVPPTPTGECIQIGNVGKSPAGYSLTPNLINAFVLNKTTGSLFQCTMTLLNLRPVGSCKAISNISSL